nr:hypothetical protein [Tanacetum cinerariifolium]
MERKYTTLITKTKAARYELVRIEDMISKQWSTVKVGYNRDVAFEISHWGPKRQLFYRSQINRLSKRDVYSTLKILSVVRIKVDTQFGYGYLEEIMDMLLLVVQHKLFHLDGDVIIDLAMALHMPKRKWPDLDKRRSDIMVDLIYKQLLERRIMWNLERLVGARELEMDYMLMQRTV